MLLSSQGSSDLLACPALICLLYLLQWAGQLGDGRAISLGQAVGPDRVPYELQLKVSCALFGLPCRASLTGPGAIPNL